MTKRALISGASGQDSRFLAERLLSQGYDVHGIIRRQSVSENQNSRVKHLEGIFKLHYGDVTDAYSLDRIFREVKPDRIFHTAAQSVTSDTFVPTLVAGLGIHVETIEELWRRYAGKHVPVVTRSTADDGTELDVEVMHPGRSTTLRALGYWGGMGTWQRVLQISRHKYTGKVSAFRQKWGSVRTTPNHSVYDIRGTLVAAHTQPELLPMRKMNYACDAKQTIVRLQPRSLGPRHKRREGGRLYHVAERSSVLSELSAQDGTLQAFLRFAGAYVSEGSAYDGDAGKRPRQVITVSQGDRAWLERLAEDVKRFYDGPMCITTHRKEKYAPVYELELRSRVLYQVMTHYFGKKSRNVRLPIFFFMLRADLWDELLGTMKQGDGTQLSTGQWRYVTTSPRLAAQLCLIHSMRGTDYTVDHRAASKNHGNYDAYVISECRSYQPNQGASEYYEEDYDGYVYDVEIEDTHNFCGGIGNLVLHNSHVRVSFDVPEYTLQTNGIGTLNMLEVYRRVCPEARFLTCCSSEQFGTAIDPDGYQRETTPMWPTSPYGCSKVLAFNLTRHWRAAYKLFATTTICFNHTSAFRGANFLTKKVVKEAVEIKLGRRHGMALGDLSPWRDFGHSNDYTAAMILALDHTEPDDFVIATGVSHQIKDVVEYVFEKLGLDWQQYVTYDARLLRAQELPRLKGDASKARRVLGWAPNYTFEALLDEMIEHELALQQGGGEHALPAR